MKRVYVVADLVGSSGVRVAEQCAPGTAAWSESRPWLTADVNAVVGAAFGAGAEEVLVCDAHASGNNLLLDALDSRAIVEEPFGPHMLPGISDEFAGLLVVGAHAMAGARDAFFDHTWDTAKWFRYRLAGDDCGEIGLWAAYAGHFNVPLLLVIGDAAACREAESFVPGVETFAVKEAISRDHARTMHPAEAAKYIAEAAGRAVAILRR